MLEIPKFETLSLPYRDLRFPESLNVHPESLNVYPESLNVHPESLNAYPESLNVHPESLNAYPESLNVHPESLNGFPDLDSAKAESCPAHLALCNPLDARWIDQADLATLLVQMLAH